MSKKTENERANLRKNYRDVWCILRTLDLHEEVDATRTGFDWDLFRRDPHRYFIRCQDDVADMIWAAVEKRL